MTSIDRSNKLRLCHHPQLHDRQAPRLGVNQRGADMRIVIRAKLGGRGSKHIARFKESLGMGVVPSDCFMKKKAGKNLESLAGVLL
eukprot:642267-Hanusia_phi.AAC.5